MVQGFQAKSAITRKSCAEIIDLFTRSWDTSVLDRGGSVLEEVIVKGIKDADPTARKLMRRYTYIYLCTIHVCVHIPVYFNKKLGMLC